MISKSHILLIMCDIYTSKGIITRPNAFFLREYDPIEKSFSKTIIIDVKHRKLPTKLIQKLEDISILKICWDEEKTSLILETLIHEAVFDIKVLPILDLKKWLRNNAYPHSSLNAIAKNLHIRQCSKANTKDKDKLRNRFNVFVSVMRKLINIDTQNLVDGILF